MPHFVPLGTIDSGVAGASFGCILRDDLMPKEGPMAAQYSGVYRLKFDVADITFSALVISHIRRTYRTVYCTVYRIEI